MPVAVRTVVAEEAECEDLLLEEWSNNKVGLWGLERPSKVGRREEKLDQANEARRAVHLVLVVKEGQHRHLHRLPSKNCRAMRVVTLEEVKGRKGGFGAQQVEMEGQKGNPRVLMGS